MPYFFGIAKNQQKIYIFSYFPPPDLVYTTLELCSLLTVIGYIENGSLGHHSRDTEMLLKKPTSLLSKGVEKLPSFYVFNFWTPLFSNVSDYINGSSVL